MKASSLQADEPETILHERFAATPAQVSSTLTELQVILAHRGLAEEPLGDILLALGEILNNIVEHSVAGFDGAHIELDVCRTGARLHVETTDRGRPLPPSLLSSAELPPMTDDFDALPEGGFGWFIIHSLAQDMVYEREAGLNRLSFAFDVA